MRTPRGTCSVLPSANKGLMIGALGVLIFAMTLPMTRLAVGPLEAPQLPPAFVTAGRAAGAGLLSVVYLWAVGAARPRGAQWGLLGVSALGTVLGFPLGLALALRQVPSMHAAVITGLLPLTTAAIAALALRQRASLGFWVCAVLGCALVLAFAAHEGGGALVAADGWLLMAMLCASGGYVAGARLSAQMPAEQVISWVLVMSLPLTLPAAWWSAPDTFASVQAASWGAFAYVTVFSMWLGFFAWYRGLALGGALRVSQVQLIQPFLSLLLAVPVLGEALKPATLGFSVAVIAVVFVGKRMPVGR
ncbi:DMT family transporter [Ideonella sp. 4Y11]|uniref:DMT family transporter n=2 Tax=Ideonella aquatica TaxID=2824119 RepID=A0A940YLE6_9BURK|nr:DMT family transporter [Ideonella aquatica]